jgi:hypothetical protein
MRTIMISHGRLAALALLATVGVAACTASQAPSSAGPGNGRTTFPAASPIPTRAASPSGTPSATSAGPGGIRNLVISSAERSALTAAFVADKGISPSDVLGAGPLPGSVYYAYDPATDTYWALTEFQPSNAASLNVKVNFQDGGNIGMFQKAGPGSWQVQTPGWPPICSEPLFFPQTVLVAWSLPTSASPGTGC